MATESPSAPNPANDKREDQVSELLQPAADGEQGAKADATKEVSRTSVFVNTEPMRDEQVQNAVKFLSHPKVRASPVIYRRSFLEKKGLTKEEIDEAFRRVPDPPPSVSSVQAPAANQDGQLKSSSVQPQAGQQILQTAATTPASVIPGPVTLAKPWFHWSQALLAVGILTASGAMTAVLLKNTIIPRFKGWIRKIVLEEENNEVKKSSLTEEAAAAAKAAAAAASDVAKTSQEMLNSKNEDKRYFEELTNLLNVQIQKMTSLDNAIRKMEGYFQNNLLGQINTLRSSFVQQEDQRGSIMNFRQSSLNGKHDSDARSGRSSSPPAPVESFTAPHPKSYIEIMAMVQRGERPPNIKDINDLPPNPNHPLPNPHAAPRTKPWEATTHAHSSSSPFIQSQTINGGFDSSPQVPWWQQKSSRITEIEAEDDVANVIDEEPPPQRTWVPPRPPPVSMPEAAAAIRQPKQAARKIKGQMDGDQLLARTPDGTDELQRITKITEVGGAAEVNGGGPDSELAIASEIQEVQDIPIKES